MKQKLFIITLLALLVASCTREPLPEPLIVEGGKMVTISAKVPSETRVSYDDGTRKLTWENNDQLLLAGYDGATYKGSEIFNWNGGNTFQGQEVTGATSYKAYYPGDIITLDADGNVQLTANFWRQTQSGDNTTAHISKKLLLFDETANPFSETFSLVMKNSIIRFNLSGIPQEVGALSQLIYTVETAAGVFKSLTLNVTGVTFSPTVSSITAFLAFDPDVMDIVANGKVKIMLVGEKSYFWQSDAIADGKNYNAGNRYKGTVTGVWTKKQIINPLSYFAEHNMANLTGTFEAGHDATGQYLFYWNDAMTAYNTTPATLGGKNYYLPTIQEWRAIIPESSTYINFNGWQPRTLSNAAVTVGRESYTMSGTFDNTGNVVYATLTYTHQSDPTLYAIARYRKEDKGTADARMVVDMQLTATSYTIGEAKNANWNSVGVVSRVFPSAGHRTTYAFMQQGEYGYYWSSSLDSSFPWYMLHNNNAAYSDNTITTNSMRSIRLVSRE